MPFDQPIDMSWTAVDPGIWHDWKNLYNKRITDCNNTDYYTLSNDARAVFFQRKTILKLILRWGINLKDDFVVFRFISKDKCDLDITPCIMTEKSCHVKYASNKVGHRSKGGKDQCIPEGSTLVFYDERLKCFKKYTEFKDDVQGIGHPVMDFIKWFLQNFWKREFAVIFLIDDSKVFKPELPQTRKMNIGFINTDILPLTASHEIDLTQIIETHLYDQGSSCCPPLKTDSVKNKNNRLNF